MAVHIAHPFPGVPGRFWQAHFARLEVDYTPIVSRDYGDVLTFRYPDGIQFELFVLSAAKAAEAGLDEAP